MNQEQIDVEYLEPEETPDAVVDLVPLNFGSPLEQFKNLFDRMANIRAKVILWEEKTVIKDSKTRDQAIQLRTTVTRTAKAIEDAYLSLTEPARAYLKEVRGYATQAQVALIGTKDDPALGVGGRLTKKVSDYAAQCKREEEEAKRKALAEQKRIEDEIAAKKAEAEAKEQALRIEEDRRIQEIEAAKLAQAQAEGHDETDQMEADLAMAEEQARIDAERAQRDKAKRDQEIADQKAKDEAQQKMVNEMAKATSKGKVKGVKEIWSKELVDESLLDKQFMTYDPAKAQKWLDGGFYNKKETDPEKIIPGLRCVIVLGKGGR
jgi:hypothetical protein